MGGVVRKDDISYARLGRTGYKVSRLGFGTVELGMSYGLPRTDGFPKPLPDREAVSLLHESFEKGVNFVDTAPGYGRAEEIVGLALSSWKGHAPVVATKVTCPSGENLADPASLARFVERSVEQSRHLLDRDRLALLQVHNATVEALESEPFSEVLQGLVERGLVAFLGASTYGPEAAHAAIENGWCASLQIAYNVLDQNPAAELIREAARRNIGVIARSVLLKGVLSAETGGLPEALRPLEPALATLGQSASQEGESVVSTCVRFALSHPDVSTCILGIDRPAYLHEDLESWQRGPLPEATIHRLRALHVGGHATDPRTWGF